MALFCITFSFVFSCFFFRVTDSVITSFCLQFSPLRLASFVFRLTFTPGVILSISAGFFRISPCVWSYLGAKKRKGTNYHNMIGLSYKLSCRLNIDYSLCVFWYQVYHAWLRKRLLNREAPGKVSGTLVESWGLTSPVNNAYVVLSISWAHFE